MIKPRFSCAEGECELFGTDVSVVDRVVRISALGTPLDTKKILSDDQGRDATDAWPLHSHRPTLGLRCAVLADMLEDVGAAAVFLASDGARNNTGETIQIDAGTHIMGQRVDAGPPAGRALAGSSVIST